MPSMHTVLHRLKTLGAVGKAMLSHPRRLSRLLEPADGEYMDYVTRRHGLAQGLPVLDILDLVPRGEETIDPYTFLGGTSLPTDVALLKALASRFQPCRYLEIGVWRGESVANVASVANHCTTLSLSSTEMREMGFSEDVIDVHHVFSAGLTNVTRIDQNSQTFDFQTLEHPFDLIYIDADHSYQGVKSDTSNAVSTRRDQNSIIVWHDYLTLDSTIRWPVLAGILDGSPRALHDRLFHVSSTLCAIYLPDPPKPRIVTNRHHPTARFSVRLLGTPV